VTIDITVAVADTARVGEGPFWDAAAGRLHWVDILSGAISSYTPSTGERTRITLPTLVGAAVPKASGGYIAATREGFADVTAGGAWATRLHILDDGIRMNDAKCDPDGRLWAGSTRMDFTAGHGALHVLDAGGRTETVLDGLTLPNGLGWSPEGRTFYLVDSVARELNAFDTDTGDTDTGDTDTGDTDTGDTDTGGIRLSNRRVLKAFGEGDGLPDGLTVDSGGCLWIAMWGGSRIVRVSPEGSVIGEVPVPVAQPSSCVFGGPRLDVLYVTTAREGLDHALPGTAVDGSVLAVSGLGVTGLPSVRFGG
jgi:sugar lactone lactonase YvrE